MTKNLLDDLKDDIAELKLQIGDKIDTSRLFETLDILTKLLEIYNDRKSKS